MVLKSKSSEVDKKYTIIEKLDELGYAVEDRDDYKNLEDINAIKEKIYEVSEDKSPKKYVDLILKDEEKMKKLLIDANYDVEHYFSRIDKEISKWGIFAFAIPKNICEGIIGGIKLVSGVSKREEKIKKMKKYASIIKKGLGISSDKMAEKTIYFCPKCGKELKSEEDFTHLKHHKEKPVEITVITLPNEVKQYLQGAWLDDYIAKLLEDNWKTCVRHYIQRTVREHGTVREHEVDVLAFKENLLMVECKTGGVKRKDAFNFLAKGYYLNISHGLFVATKELSKDIQELIKAGPGFFDALYIVDNWKKENIKNELNEKIGQIISEEFKEKYKAEEEKHHLLDAIKKTLQGGPIWSDENHPELSTPEEIDRYVWNLRASWRISQESESNG